MKPKGFKATKRGIPFLFEARSAQKNKANSSEQAVGRCGQGDKMMTNRTSVLQDARDGKEIAPLPSNNMGVVNTSDQEIPPNSILLDYLRFTLPYSLDAFTGLSEWVVGQGERQATGMNGYTHRSTVLKTGFVLWHPERKEMGIHVVLPAGALSQVDLTPIGLMNWVLGRGGHFTRVDIAYDDFSGSLDIGEMDRKLRDGEVVTRWKKAKSQSGSYRIGEGIDDGEGVTIGSRSSEAYCRIYDKKMERKAKDIDVDVLSWVRVEIELKGKKSQELAKVLTSIETEKSPGEILSSLLYGLLDFKEPGDDTNKSRWVTSEWWSYFMGASEKLTLTLPKDERTLDEVKEWFDVYVSQMAAVILLAEMDEGEVDGYNWLMASITAGSKKLKGHHKRIIMNSLHKKG